MVLSDTLQLREIIGKPLPLVDVKVIDFLDEGALNWIGKSPLAFINFSTANTVAVTIGGGRIGFACGDERELSLPFGMLDNPEAASPGASFGSVFLLPGIIDILRVNGKVSSVSDGVVRVVVKECYMHCGKALLRSDFWSAVGMTGAPGEEADFLAASRFLALATCGLDGHADLSPKGDWAGTMALIDRGRFWFADRPGNRRLDSFQNILTQPRVAILAVIPGTSTILKVGGTAKIETDPEIRARFEVEGKVPVVATGVTFDNLYLMQSDALQRANLWPSWKTEDINPGKIGVQHLRLNKSVKAKLAGSLILGATKLFKEETLAKKVDEELKKSLF